MNIAICKQYYKHIILYLFTSQISYENQIVEALIQLSEQIKKKKRI